MTVALILVLLAIVLTCVSVAGHCPLWAPVFILCVVMLVQSLGVK